MQSLQRAKYQLTFTNTEEWEKYSSQVCVCACVYPDTFVKQAPQLHQK